MAGLALNLWRLSAISSGRLSPNGHRFLLVWVGKLIWLAVFLTLALTSGCAHVQLPERDLAARLDYDKEAAARYRLDPNWWRAYNDQRLNEIVALAESANLDLAKIAVNLSRSLIQLGLSKADLFPTFSGSASASSRRELERSSPSTRSFGGNFGLSYEVDLWRKISGAVDVAKWEYQASLEDLEAARLTLINQVINAYYNIAYLNDAIVENERNLKNLLAVEKIVLVKHESGQAAAVEPLQAAQSILGAKDDVLNVKQRMEEARQTLKNLLNLRPADEFETKDLTLKGVTPPGLDLSVPLTVLANRPDLKAAEFRLFKAYKSAKNSEKAWLPSISLSSAIASSAESFSETLNYPQGSVGLSLSLPFLDFYRVYKNVQISELEFETARLNFESLLSTALNEVDYYYKNYKTLREILSHSGARLRLNQGISAYYRERYQAGAAELSDWLNAVNSANSSSLALLQATYQLIMAENQTFQAMGGRYVDLNSGNQNLDSQNLGNQNSNEQNPINPGS
ncbi:MAG: TolC family protein [Deltaproteobacteria bacterium]|jgi:outer membrane protein TolC|nr:TolC family protein [Deltaproteobacteria bacterium]